MITAQIVLQACEDPVACCPGLLMVFSQELRQRDKKGANAYVAHGPGKVVELTTCN